MTTTPSMTDLKQLLERLLRKEQRFPVQGGGSLSTDGKVTSYITDDGKRLVNPDGPEAAQAILILSEENRRLREALEPFGDVDGEGDEDYPDSLKVVAKFGRCTDYCLTLGDFRRARTALHAEGERE
jgi:hypothetical protein